MKTIQFRDLINSSSLLHFVSGNILQYIPIVNIFGMIQYSLLKFYFVQICHRNYKIEWKQTKQICLKLEHLKIIKKK